MPYVPYLRGTFIPPKESNKSLLLFALVTFFVPSLLLFRALPG